MAPDALSLQNLHLKLATTDPMAFVVHLTNQVWKEVVDHIPAADRSPELYLALRRSVEGEMREHVVAMDLCGLSAVCHEAVEVDPWPVAARSDG
jgi:hypothetical protein